MIPLSEILRQLELKSFLRIQDTIWNGYLFFNRTTFVKAAKNHQNSIFWNTKNITHPKSCLVDAKEISVWYLLPCRRHGDETVVVFAKKLILRKTPNKTEFRFSLLEDDTSTYIYQWKTKNRKGRGVPLRIGKIRAMPILRRLTHPALGASVHPCPEIMIT